MSDKNLLLSSIVNSYQQSVERIDDSWNIPIAELNNLGIPEDMHEKIREIGAEMISLITEKLKFDIHWLNEIADDQKYFVKLAVPQEKFAKFLIEDFDESIASLQSRTWFYRSIAPDAEKQKKKWDTHLNAQMQKRARLHKAYLRYFPTITEKLKNLLAKKEAEAIALEKRAAEIEAKTEFLNKEVAEKEALVDSLTAKKASLESVAHQNDRLQ